MATVDWIDRGYRRGERLLVCGEMGVIGVDLEIEDSEVSGGISEALKATGVARSLQQALTKQVGEQFGGSCYAGLLRFDPELMRLSAPIVATSVEFGSSDEVAEKAGNLLGRVVKFWTDWLTEHLPADAHYALRPVWEPATEVARANRPTLARSEEAELEARLGRLLRRRVDARRGRWKGKLLFFGFSSVAFLCVALAIYNPDFALFALAFGGYSMLYVGIGLFAWVSGVSEVRDADTDIRRITEEIDIRHIDEGSEELRAEKLFLAHGSDLKRYYDQALQQAKYVYYIGVTSLSLGGVIVVVTFVVILSGLPSGFHQQILVASLGGLTALLSNYIAVIYLRMFSGAITAMTGFHSRLVSTHHLHFANLLTTKIDDQSLRFSALAEMATALSQQSPWSSTGPVEGPTAPGEPTPATRKQRTPWLFRSRRRNNGSPERGRNSSDSSARA